MSGLIYPTESGKLFGLALQLHKELGCGFKEKVYQDAFEVLLQENNIPYERENTLRLNIMELFWNMDFSMISYAMTKLVLN